MADLTTLQRSLLKEALRRGVDLASGLEAKLVTYGRWLLANVFENDVDAALDPKTQNAVWLALVRRAGGPQLPIGGKTLYVALRIAAYDRRIDDPAWRSLDAGRKELLLPLRDEELLRQAAHHVSKFDLTHAKTTEFVSEVRLESGQRAVPRVTAPLLIARMKRFRENLATRGMLRKLRALGQELDAKEKNALAVEIDEVRRGLSRVARELRGR